MTELFVIRPDHRGYTDCGLWTGEPAVVTMTPQTNLSRDSAKSTAELLNRHNEAGDRRILQ